jgi:hypothetical protein
VCTANGRYGRSGVERSVSGEDIASVAVGVLSFGTATVAEAKIACAAKGGCECYQEVNGQDSAHLCDSLLSGGYTWMMHRVCR